MFTINPGKLDNKGAARVSIKKEQKKIKNTPKKFDKKTQYLLIQSDSKKITSTSV